MNGTYNGLCLQHTTPEDEVLYRLIPRNQPDHGLSHECFRATMQGKFLEFISHMIKPSRILEIGTFTGYSAICLARGLADRGNIAYH